MTFFRGKWPSALGFLGVAALILGGLGWTTRAALRVEDEQRTAAAGVASAEHLYQLQTERADQVRLALWRLDSRLSPALAREESRPYPQYIALHTPFPALTGDGFACAPGQVFLPSPLLTAELPVWMRLHFQIDAVHGWSSPQVVPDELQKLLRKQPIELALNNVTAERSELLDDLKGRYPPASIMTSFREMGVTPAEDPKDSQRLASLNELVNSAKFQKANPTNGDSRGVENPPQAGQTNASNGLNTAATKDQLDYANRAVVNFKARREGQWAYIFDDNRATVRLGSAFPSRTALAYQTVEVQLGSMRPIWLPSAEKPDHLLMVRGATVGGKPSFQGIVIDWPKLQEILRDDVADLFPDAKFAPLPPGEPPHPALALTTLPVEFNPASAVDEPPVGDPTGPAGWTPLRIGLASAWGAALVALIAVGLGGWSLLALSDRRIRFVSAVTHELRTPMTTLRLYLDLLSSGMVTEEAQKAEYLTTLNGEAERLNRLIGNVLDFARLEKSRPVAEKRPVAVAGLLAQIDGTWRERCAAAGKTLVVEDGLPAGATVVTDAAIVEQVISNLIDNAQKYSREASDARIVLRAVVGGRGVAIEVEDRGPGVTKRESGSIFRPFRRGHDADVKAGGVGLGLALATRWAHLLGGRLSVRAGHGDIGACFRLELPA